MKSNLLVFFLFCLFSCKNSNSDKIIAKVYDYTLYYEDIIDDFPTYVSDSSSYINNFIDTWVSEKVLLNQVCFSSTQLTLYSLISE